MIKLLKAIDLGKATGRDKKSLKITAGVVSPSLACIFNQSILTGIFPCDWKLAKVSPIFKTGSKSDLNNYRPISGIPAVAKIFEKIQSMINFTSENGVKLVFAPYTVLLQPY